MKKINYVSALLVLITLIFAGGMVIPASAMQVDHPAAYKLSVEDKELLSSQLRYYGATESNIRELIHKLEDGEKWDSFNEQKIPVSTVSYNKDFDKETVETFEDGSVRISTVPNFYAIEQASHYSLRSNINGCQYHQSGATRYWNNCDGTVNLLYISMGFTFNYQNVNHKNPKITKYGPYHHHIIGGALSNFRFDRISDSQVRLSADLDVAFRGFPIGWTAWMQVNVTGDNAWTSSN